MGLGLLESSCLVEGSYGYDLLGFFVNFCCSKVASAGILSPKSYWLATCASTCTEVCKLVVHRRGKIGIMLGCQNQRLTVSTINSHLAIALDNQPANLCIT